MRQRKINIRAMRASDTKAVARMMRDLAAFHGDKAKISDRELIAYATGPKKLSHILVAFADKSPIGFVATYDWVNFVRGIKVRHIDAIFVLEKYRYSGVGLMLIKAVAKNAVKEACMRVTIGAMKDNKIANEFYKKLGFEKRVDPSTRYFLAGPRLQQLAIR